MDFLHLETSVWQILQEETRPLVLYGMGDGADKILQQFTLRNIQISAVFASDEFVRGHSFAGFRVQKLSEVVEQFGEDIVIILAFASQRPELLARFCELDARFTLVAPDVPVVPGAIFDEQFLAANMQRLEAAYDLLADDCSRAVFLDTVRFKLSGKLKYLRQSETTKEEIFQTVLRPTESECFADLGAYTGDTIRELLSYTNGHYASIVALEPDRRNFRKLDAYAQTLTGDVQIVQAGAWSEDCVKKFAAKAGRQSKVAKDGIETQMRALDSVLGERQCTMLKMDVEGAEREAIAGATMTIRRDRPKLNIAAYHRSEDFFELPLLLHEICPSYRLYLRHHPYVPAWDTNVYAVSE